MCWSGTLRRSVHVRVFASVLVCLSVRACVSVFFIVLYGSLLHEWCYSHMQKCIHRSQMLQISILVYMFKFWMSSSSYLSESLSLKGLSSRTGTSCSLHVPLLLRFTRTVLFITVVVVWHCLTRYMRPCGRVLIVTFLLHTDFISRGLVFC
jgi:hypothetical protein